MKRKLERLRTLPENQCRAELAELRHGIGHAPGELPAIWGAFLTDLPEEFYRNDGNASPAEWAVYTALTMFALHQQGHDFRSEWMNEDGMKFGASVRKLAKDEDELKRIRARFNKIATASDVYKRQNGIGSARAQPPSARRDKSSQRQRYKTRLCGSCR